MIRVGAAALTMATVCFLPVGADGRAPVQARSSAKVEIVETAGCAERRNDGSGWWLTQAVEPTVTRAGVFNINEVDEARTAALGSRTFALVGVADFLDAEGLLASADRASFTTVEQANATGELQEGRKVLVKGALIETDADPRINLLSVVSLGDTCE